MTEGAVVGPGKVHLYNADNILRPQGSLRNESLSNRIFEELCSAYESWANPVYVDSIDDKTLIKLLQKNLKEEIEIGVETFLKALRDKDVVGAYRYK